MKKEASENRPKILHGNCAKVDPHQHVESLYQQYRVTQALHRENGVPVPNEEDVEYARDFVDQNEK